MGKHFSSIRVFVASTVCFLATASWVNAGPPRIVSKYTSTARANALEYKEFSGEGTDGFRTLFAGLGGYNLEHLAGDERSWINVRHGNHTVDLYAATMEAGGGTFPRKANDVVEWRGVETRGVFTPCAIIYRIEAGNDETRKTHTRLVVIKLDREKSAIIGFAKGNDEKAAQAIADRACSH